MKRIYEIIPGASAWITVLTPFFLAYFKPIALAYFVILFDLYWLYKAIIMAVHLISGYFHYKRDIKIDWIKRLKEVEDFGEYQKKLLKKLQKEKSLFERIKTSEELENLASVGVEGVKSWKELYHVILLPNYKEEVETSRLSILSYKNANWPKKKLIVVLATEEREGKEGRRKAEVLDNEFKNDFKAFLITRHPDNLPGEIKAKGANINWAAIKLKSYLAKNKIDSENVLVSAFDGDTRVHPQYFACLTYKYITNPNRTRRTYQPIPLYSNNIWHVPALARIVAFSSTFWQLIESTRPYRMVNFSSQAMSMKTLEEIDFWDKTVVSEDSRQYYRAYFRYAGDHRVIPIFTPVYMDATAGKTLFQTLKAQYRQKRRWAWGSEHFSYLCQKLPKHKEIPLLSRLIQLWRAFEGHYSWATASLLIAFSGWLPFALNPLFKSTVLAYNLPRLARYLLGLTWIGIFVSTYVSLKLLPQRPVSAGIYKKLSMYVQWALVPISAIFFGSIPALDAQTKLMLGKKMKFETTKKIPIAETNQ